MTEKLPEESSATYRMFKGYMEAVGFTDPEGEIDQTFKCQALEDCADFQGLLHQEGLAEEVEADPERAGADFWLTRNHHGAGFWDGNWERGDELTKWAHTYGGVDILPAEEVESE